MDDTRTRWGRVVVLGLLTALGPVSIDLYLPAFPEIQRELRAGDAAVQATLAGMTLGLAAGQLVVGVWSDRAGRRVPLLWSTGLHLAATVACAVAPTVAALTAARFVQGLGAAGSAVLVLAVVRDLADGRALVVLLGRVTLVTTTAPLLAPVAGAELLPVAGWRGIFVVLAGGSAVVLVAAAAFVPETHRPAAHPPPLRARLAAVGRDRTFRRATLVAAMTYAGVYAYVAASPLLLRDVHGLSARAYALVFLANSAGLVAGVQLGTVLARRAGAPRVLAGAAAVTVLAAAAIVPLEAAGAGLAGLLPCLWLFVAGCGGSFPCAEALALDGQPGQAGTASSVHGFVTFAAAGLIAPLAGIAGIADAVPVAAVLLGTSVTALAGAIVMARSRAGAAARTAAGAAGAAAP